MLCNKDCWLAQPGTFISPAYVCRKSVKYCGNTNNLYKHLKIHKTQYTELQSRREEERELSERPPAPRQSSLAESLQRGREYPGNLEDVFHFISGDSPRASAITRSLCEMIMMDLQPLSVVEDKGFRNFAKTMDPRYKSPSRKSLMEGKIPSLFAECHSKVQKYLDSAEHAVLTTDMWTSRSTEAYLTVSCHVIDDDWQMQAFVLETCSFTNQHTAENISSELIKITTEWGITDKVQAVITDKAFNMVNAVQKANSIKALPDLLSLKERCNAIVSFFHHSTRATERLKVVQKQHNFPEHKLILAVETRWNSLSYMLERLLEQREAITTALCLFGKSTLCMTEEEWSLIMIPLVSLLLRSTASYSCEGSKLAAELSAQCQHRFRNIETFYGLAVSTFLDIRFKNLGFRNSTNVETMKARLLTDMQSLQASAPRPSSSSSSASAMASTSHAPAESATPPPAQKGIWAEFDSQVLATQQHRTTGTDVLIEMHRYSEEKQILRDQDPLLWWKNNQPTFPTLSKLAKKHLSVIATSVPSERIFSTAQTSTYLFIKATLFSLIKQSGFKSHPKYSSEGKKVVYNWTLRPPPSLHKT
uniref:HAT C-terminal dimerisation domain-containing protein n=1 Tax=Paramormyrops kingsleyae TaxID=1676925 RepID=A0A3B3S4P9_9TELE